MWTFNPLAAIEVHYMEKNPGMFSSKTLKAPIMSYDYERLIFWFWESPITGWHACKVKKHFHELINELINSLTFIVL